jgi:predicted nucleic acid-binding protein
VSEVAVVDASALAAAAFSEPRGAIVSERMRDRNLAAPELLRYELLSIAAKKLRREPASAALIRQGLAWPLGGALQISWCDIRAFEVFDLALETGVTPYDASYLWLAKHLGADLIMLDTALAEAARKVL